MLTFVVMVVVGCGGSNSSGSPTGSPNVGSRVPSSCAGRMATNSSLQYDAWSLHYGISNCEGLVASDVSLGSRVMAERMSLPYLDLVTCRGKSGGRPVSIGGCGTYSTRHIVLAQSGVEASSQSGSTQYTQVSLLSPPKVRSIGSDPSPPCNGQPPCEHISIEATYRVYLTPPTHTAADQYLDVTQNYEFYKDFKERDFKDLACEPSQNATIGHLPIGGLLTPLEDCGRWKPLVTYQYHAGNSPDILVSLNAAERLHFTPDSLAVRASTLARDCDSDTPSTGCGFLGALNRGIELYPPTTSSGEHAIQKEAVIRAVQAAKSGNIGNLAGRYDNLHLTPANEVSLPQPPPGCAECVHIHWRWGANLDHPAAIAVGAPLLGDGEPAAVDNATSHQQLDVALVAYHSEELVPHNFMDLIQGASSGALDMSRSSNTDFSGGYSQGDETLSYPSGSCYAADAPSSWGQCGEVVWLSATSYSTQVDPAGIGNEDNDTFFAFGGFFCQSCGNSDSDAINYSGAGLLHPRYEPDVRKGVTLGPGQPLRIILSPVPNLLGRVQIYDVLPEGMTNITASIQPGPPPVPRPGPTHHPVSDLREPGCRAGGPLRRPKSGGDPQFGRDRRQYCDAAGLL